MGFALSGRKIDLTRVVTNETINKVMILKGSKDKSIKAAIMNDKGGLGDVLLDAFFAAKIRERFDADIRIDYYSKYSGIFNGEKIFDSLYPLEEKAECDLLFRSKHFMYILAWNPEKIKKISPELYDVCRKIIDFQSDSLGNRMDISSVYHFAKFFGKTRVEASDLLGLIGVSKNDTVLLSCDPDEESVLKKFDLENKSFITFNRDVDSKESLNHPKIWPLDHYNKLAELLRNCFSDISLVQVGATDRFGKIQKMDYDLTGRTSLSELKIILRKSILNVSSEGGLVHLMHFLGGRSAVIFGPTDEEYFGYDNDLIFKNRKCARPCNYLKPRWLDKCILGDSEPSCMVDLLPEQVYDGIYMYIRDKQNL